MMYRSREAFSYAAAFEENIGVGRRTHQSGSSGPERHIFTKVRLEKVFTDLVGCSGAP